MMEVKIYVTCNKCMFKDSFISYSYEDVINKARSRGWTIDDDTELCSAHKVYNTDETVFCRNCVLDVYCDFEGNCLICGCKTER